MGEELWYVKVADDDVHRMTLDQLDGAFQAGHIDESTMVLPADATKWTKLGELLGLEDGGEPPEEAAAAPPASSYASRAYPAPVPAGAVVVTGGATAPVRAVPAMVPAARVVGVVPNTLRPMSIDLEDGDLDLPFRRSSRKGWVFGVIGVAAIAGGVGVVATRGHALSQYISSTSAAAAVAAPPPAAPPEAPAPPPPAPVVAASPATPAANGGATEASPMNPHFTDHSNEDPKLKLLAAEKGHEPKTKGHHAGGGATSHSASKAKSTTFTTGGNKYDPLNSSI